VKRPVLLVAAVVAATLLGGCGSSAAPAQTQPTDTSASEPPPSSAPIVLPSNAPKKLTVSSTAFADGKPIPEKYTCNGESALPPLSWSGDLAGGKDVAIVVDDPDAPAGGYVHWIVVDLPASVTKLDPDKLPDNIKEASNSDGDNGWSAPCPPSGTHHYRFTVYSLDGPTGVEDGTDPVEALTAIGTHAKAYGQLTGTVTAP
jgi:Raf kinase inhibitor-like YbhB/YbcL family protein